MPVTASGALEQAVSRTAVERPEPPRSGGSVTALPGVPAGHAAEDDAAPDWQTNEEDRRGPAGGAATGQASEKQRDYASVHIYGSRAALCFNADMTRAEGHTICLDAAASKGQRSFNWEGKIRVQFTTKELPFVLAVLMGWMTSVQFTAHGPKKDKGFSLEHQAGGKVFARVWQGNGGGQLSVPIFAEDLYGVVALLLRQMGRNSPHLGVDGVMAVVRQLSSTYQERGLEVKPPPQRSAAA